MARSGTDCSYRSSNPIRIDLGPSTCLFSASVDKTTVPQGQVQTTRWSAQNQNQFALYLQQWNGSTWIVMDMRPWAGGSDGRFAGANGNTTALAWTVPRDLPPNSYRVRVVVAGSSSSQEGVTPFFAVTPVTGVSSVTANPTALREGMLQQVAWSSISQESYEVSRCGADGNGCVPVVPRTTSTGTRQITWTVPGTLAPGSYRMKVRVWSSLNVAAEALSNLFSVAQVLVSLVQGSIDVGEASGTISVPVRLITPDGAATSSAVSVQTVVTGVSASSSPNGCASGDFLPFTTLLTFPAGTPSGSTTAATMAICNDSLDEPGESFDVAISAAVGAMVGEPQVTRVTIVDDDPTPALTIDDAGIMEGNSGEVILSLRVWLSAPSGQTVAFTYHTELAGLFPATSGVDYQNMPGNSASFPPGSTSYNLQLLRVIGDRESEQDEQVRVRLDSVTGATVAKPSALVTIQNDDFRPGHDLWSSFFAVGTQETPMTGDFDGDGLADIVTFGRNNPNAVGDVYVSLSTGASFGPSVKWHDWFAVSPGERVLIGDYNGDGNDDAATWLATTTRQVYTALSSGSGLLPPAVWLGSIGSGSAAEVMLAGDANGDGRDDLILFTRPDVYVALSQGASFAAPVRWHTWFAVGALERPRVADVNGDDRADIVTFATNAPAAFGDVYVALSNGSSFGPAAKWHDWFAINPAELVGIGDTNGDGRDDFLTFLTPASGGQCYTVQSTGSGMGPNMLWHETIRLFPADDPQVADVNGDERADVVIFARSEGRVYVSLAPSP